MTRFYLVESRQIIVNANGDHLKIRPQSYRVFSFLLDHENTVVSKDDLFENVWESVAVTDDSITQCIADIRKVLGPKYRNLLRTIPKKGFRLSAGGDANNPPIILKTRVLSADTGLPALADQTDISVANEKATRKAEHSATTATVLLDQQDTDKSEISVGSQPVPSETSTQYPKTEPRLRTPLSTQNKHLWAAGAALLVCIGLLTFIFRPNHEIADNPGTMSVSQSQELPSIAVLPFQNLSGVVADDYLSDGTTEDLTTDLSTLGGLVVIARNSVSAYKNRAIDNQAIARDLNVRYILNGSVRRSGSRIRINVELTDTNTRAQLWADRYDGEVSSIFDMQDQINQSVVKALALKLTLSEQQRLAQRPTENLQAYNLYQLGRSYTFSNQHALGQEYLQNAVAIDPNFSGAYAALAYHHSIAVSFGQSDNIEFDLDRAFRLATKAVSMDNHSAEAHVALSQTFLLRGQHDEALRSAKRAIDSNPSYAPAHGVHGWVHGLSGNYSAALDAFSRAIRLQPTSNGVVLGVQGSTYYLAGRYDEAAAILEESNTINPNLVTTHAFLAATYQRLGRYDDSEWEAQEVTVLSPDFKINTWRWVQVFKNKDSPSYLQFLEDLQAAGLLME